jgi:hypothetical protein
MLRGSRLLQPFGGAQTRSSGPVRREASTLLKCRRPTAKESGPTHRNGLVD